MLSLYEVSSAFNPVFLWDIKFVHHVASVLLSRATGMVQDSHALNDIGDTEC